jgi:hypothetical protein
MTYEKNCIHHYSTSSFSSTLKSKTSDVKPKEAGLSSKRLIRIKPVMQRNVDEKKLPGLISMVAREPIFPFSDLVVVRKCYKHAIQLPD